MSSSNSTEITIEKPNEIIYCKEVRIPGKQYSKLITTDEHTIVLYSPSYGEGWSSGVPANIAHQLLFDSRIILFLSSCDYTCDDKTYYEFMKSIMSHPRIPSFETFKNLYIKYIPENTMFRINEYDGAESVEIFNPKSYYLS